MADRTHSHDTSTPAMTPETVPSEEFVRVPREPTREMIKAGYAAYDLAMTRIRMFPEAPIASMPNPMGNALRAAISTLSASHLAKEGGEAGAVEPIEKHRIANRLRGMFDMSVPSEGDFNRLTPAGFRLLRQAHDALIAPDEAVAAPAPNPSPAAKEGGGAEAILWQEKRGVWKRPGATVKHVRMSSGHMAWRATFDDGRHHHSDSADDAKAYADGFLAREQAEAFSTPTEGPASQTEGMGGEVKAKAKQALYSLRFEGQPMSSMFSAEELGLIVDTVSAALSTPTEGPASQTEGMGGAFSEWELGVLRQSASAKHLVYLGHHAAGGLRPAEIETMERWRALCDKLAALTPPKTAEAIEELREEIIVALWGVNAKGESSVDPDDFDEKVSDLLTTAIRLLAGKTLTIPPETAEAVPVAEQLEDIAQRCRKAVADRIGLQVALDATKAELADAKRERDDAVKALKEARAATASDPAPATDDRERLVEVLRKIAETRWDAGALDAVLTMIQADARAVLATEASR